MEPSIVLLMVHLRGHSSADDADQDRAPQAKNRADYDDDP